MKMRVDGQMTFGRVAIAASPSSSSTSTLCTLRCPEETQVRLHKPVCALKYEFAKVGDNGTCNYSWLFISLETCRRAYCNCPRIGGKLLTCCKHFYTKMKNEYE